MISFYESELIDGVSVYRDHEDRTKWYLLPNTPRFRLDENGNPVFKFIKYKHPVDRADGKIGGAFVTFDIEFTVPDAQVKKVREKLQDKVNQEFRYQNPKPQVSLGRLNPLNRSILGMPSVTVQLFEKSGKFIEEVRSSSAPSIYGNFIAPVTIELSQEGATLCERALKGGGGSVQVAYHLPMITRLPPIKGQVTFNASKFMSYHRSVETEINGGGLINWVRSILFGGRPFETKLSETISEFFSTSESGTIDIEPGAVTDPKVLESIREWGFKTMENALQRMILPEIDPVNDSQQVILELVNKKVTKSVIENRVVDFTRIFKENMLMEWDPMPRGTLTNITALPNMNEANLAKYFETIDLDDPFYKQIRLTIQPNVDFQNLPIHSIVAHIDYPKSDGKVSKDFTFKSLSDIGKFNCFIENNNWKYKYSYKVNFKNSSHVVEAPPIESESTNLIINVGDTGVLTVDLMPGDLDWGQLRAAQITMRYEPDGKVPIEQQFLMDKDRQNHRFQHIVFSAVNKPYKYKVKYLMKDGKEYQADWVQSQSSTLMINDVWDATKVVGVRARGNFDTDVESILVNVVYTDDQNKYTQSRSIELDRDNRSFEWKFPVINEMSGKLIYSGTIKYLNNSEETIAKTETTDNTIWVGPKVTGFIEVSIMPDLIDFDQVKLAKLTLQYRDPVNSVNVKRDFVFKPGQTDSGIFKVELKDKTKTAYQWQGMFFMVDGSVKKTALITSEELTLVPQLSDAV